MRILITCPLVPGRYPDSWEPQLEAVRREHGFFPARWSLDLKNKTAVIVAEVDDKQLEAVQGVKDIVVEDQSKATELDTASKAGDNKGLTKLDQEVSADVTRKSRSIIVPGIVAPALLIPKTLNRRQLLKLAGIGAGIYALRPRMAHSTISFTDSFTEGLDTALDAHGGPDWDFNSANEFLYVNAANDRVQMSSTSDSYARIIAAGAPTGSQLISADVFADSTPNNVGLCCRMDSGGSADFYLVAFYDDDTVEVYRVDAGSYVLLTSDSRALGMPQTASFQAVTNGSQVDLEAIIGGTTAITASDTDANRKLSGTPGIWEFSNSPDGCYVDNVSVDNLASVATVRHRVILIQ